MIEQNKIIEGGLVKNKRDDRDQSFTGVFGAGEIPVGDFVVAEPLEIKDQGSLDFCTGYSLSSVSEDQEGVKLDPAFAFAMIKKIQGNWKSWGGSLRDGAKVATKIGFIEIGDNPLDFGTKDRNYLANWNNWPAELELKAKKHIKQSFLRVDGGNDHFDNVRSALWQNRASKESIYTGCIWRPSWMSSLAGMIPERIINGGVGHAVKCFGVRHFNSQPYLMIQNSFGTDVGDNGIFYVSRKVFNREFTFQSYQFTDMPQEEIKNILRGKGILIENKNDWFNRLTNYLKTLLTTLSKL